MFSTPLSITTLTTNFPHTVKQETVTKQHEMTINEPCLITLSGPARVIIIPVSSPDNKVVCTFEQRSTDVIQVKRDDRTWFSYRRDKDGIWTSLDTMVQATCTQVDKDKVFLPTNEDEQVNFLCALEDNELKVNIILPTSSNKIPSINGVDMVYEKDGISGTTSIDVVTPDEKLIKYTGDKDQNDFIETLNKTNLLAPFDNVQAKPVVQCKGFILGRKAQFISDYYPLVSRDKGRASKMSKLLPSLIANNAEIKDNYYLCMHSSKKIPNLDSYFHPNLDKYNAIDQYKLGRDYQFLQDSNCVKGNLDLLTPDQIKEQAASFRAKLNEGYFNLRKNRQEFQDTLDQVDIVECRGDKCRINFEDGNNEHCESCYSDLTIEDIARVLHSKNHNNGYYGEYSELDRIIRES